MNLIDLVKDNVVVVVLGIEAELATKKEPWQKGLRPLLPLSRSLTVNEP